MDVRKTERMSSTPTAPIMPSVSARPWRNVRGRVPQMRLSARSMTAKTYEPAPPYVLERLDGRAQELARAGVDFDDARQRLAARGEAVARDEQDEQRGEEREQPEVAHRRGGREEVVLVELVEGLLEYGRPRRVVLHAPTPAREEWKRPSQVLHQRPLDFGRRTSD